MTVHQFVEDAPLADTRILDSGAMVASVRCARTGIQDYAGFELGYPDRERIRIVRPEDAVFDPASMRTYAHRPVTNDHPDEPVTPTNWREHGVGHLGDTVRRDGEYVRVDMMLSDAKTIADVQGGKVQLSAGYTADLEMFDEPRETPYGMADAQMTGFVINHLAVVDRARAGPSAAIGARDAATPSTTWGAAPITDGTPSPKTDAAPAPSTITEDRQMGTRTILVDGLQVETTDAGVAAIEKVSTERQTAVDALATAKTAHDAETERLKGEHTAAIADKDKEIGTKDAKITELEGKVLDAAAIDALVVTRTALVAKASGLAKEADFSGKTDAEIKAIAVDAVHGKGFSDGKSEAWVEGVFDAAKAPEGTGDPVADALKSRKLDDTTADHGQSAYDQRLADAWKNTTGAAA